ncbi:MAG: alginate lyase family protein [Flavobacterium sp.]|nr:MAG: alginate lyase family protein [Flavobacterium sp.]
MLKKIGLLINTVRYLKPIQVFYQIFYRLKPLKNLQFYIDEETSPSQINFLHFDGKAFPKTSVAEDGKFEFLNLTQSFTVDVDWDFQGYGKLWNYNLQYFNFLNESSLSTQIKLHWLNDIGSWLKTGRLKLEPYPVSLRIINMIRFCSLEKIDDTTIIEEVKGQGNYLSKHLEYHLLGNHLLENAFALLMSGYFFKESKWTNKAKSILYRQLDEQILNDGCHFELSPMYHQIILFRMLELVDWYSKINDDPKFLNFLKLKVGRMCSFLKELTFSNGDIPHFNDSADNITLRSEQLFEYAGKLGVSNFVSVGLKNSGYRTFNHPKYKCIVDVGEIGPSYQPGHGHSDALAFILYYKNQPLIVDVGTSTYQIGKIRSYERSTAAHNTVVIADTNQSQVWGGFRVGKRAVVNITEDNDCTLTASHNGYLSNFGILHRRSFVFSESAILIQDDIENEAGEANFHFHPDCSLLVVNSEVILVHLNLTLSFDSAKSVNLEEYQYANGFNEYKLAQKVVVKFEKKLNSTIKF